MIGNYDDDNDSMSMLRRMIEGAGIQGPDVIDLSPTRPIDPNDMAPMMAAEPGAWGQEASDAKLMRREAVRAIPGQGAGGLPGNRLVDMYQAFASAKSAELYQMLRHEQYYHGKHYTAAELAALAAKGHPGTYINELRKKVESYIGIEQRMRRDPKAQPATPRHEGDADSITAAMRRIHVEADGPTVYSECGQDYFVRGIGAQFSGVEKKPSRENPQVMMRRIPGISFIYDPRSFEHDFKDAKFLGEWAWFDIEDAEELMVRLGRPDSAQLIRGLAGQGDHAQAGSIPGEWARQRADWWQRDLGRIRLVHMYYRHRGDWRCAYFCGPIVLYDEVSIYEDEYGNTRCPISAMSCYVDEEGTRYGVVKDMIPLQDSINHRHAKLLWMISVRQLIVEKGAVDDVRKAREQAKRADGVIELNPRGKEGIERKFQILTMDAEIKGQADLLQFAIAQMQNYGPNTAILGKGETVDNASGRALLARQNAGMTEMSLVFDRHRTFKINSFKGHWLLVRQFWTAEEWIETTDEDGGLKFVGLNTFEQDPQSGAYREVNNVAKMDVQIIVDEGPDTVVMEEELMQTLGQMGEAALGPLGRVMIELSGIRNKKRLFKLLDEATKPDPAVVEMQQRMAKLEELLGAAKVDKEIASAEKARAEAAAIMTDAMITPHVMQEFPIRWGAPSFVEQALGESLNPYSSMNAFLEPIIPAGPSTGPQGAPPSQPPAPGGGAPFQPPKGQPGPAMPGQEPVMGEEGGLPMPGPQSPNGLQPPPNTRV